MCLHVSSLFWLLAAKTILFIFDVFLKATYAHAHFLGVSFFGHSQHTLCSTIYLDRTQYESEYISETLIISK